MTLPKITRFPANDHSDPSAGKVSENDVVLYENRICPFVQRVRIALAEKEQDYVAVEIDLTKPRPEWYLKDVNYRGKVPALSYQGKVLFESTPLVEYVDEIFSSGSKLFPSDAYRRQVSRSWIQFAGDSLIPAFYGLLMERNEEQQKVKKEKLDNVFLEIEEALQKYQTGQGAFFFGDEFTAVDANFLPFLERLCILKHYRAYQLPDKATRVQKWIDAGLKRETVKSTTSEESALINAYEKYAQGGK
eukprot:CAMPEP_0117453986 /NCGR_PEP_ID=MMETSP0759-20121206/10541_1 /TAXON_ID=63605 /ORGANISM="Percolomonas cosmopolitus, Strain WS" /LENGTH=246 /DNA_ID=CAMNT_0005247105 /DNA_START=75 /DNA_END=815 /DNA_ORIENTATION=+